jgi:circadian clock protein KaiC
MADTQADPTTRTRELLELIDTGVPGLNEVLGGGIPALSFNLVAGKPGSGKTTLAMQLLFANATVERPGLFITLLGETSLKMLRYQQQFDFFDADRVGQDVHFLNLSEEALAGALDAVLERVTSELTRLNPGIVVIDSFRSLVRAHGSESPDRALEQFVQRLALNLTTWETTSFLIGEYQEHELRNPVFTVADGIIWLSQAVDRNSVVRKLQVVKMRGMASMPGLHTIRMARNGVQVFPRIPEPVSQVRGGRPRTRGPDDERDNGVAVPRLSTGIAGLDDMMGGGIPAGDSLVLAGPTGTGKTTFAIQFVIAGLQLGESAVIAIFEEHPDAYLERARSNGVDLHAAVRSGQLRIIYLRPLDLSVDETLDEIRTAVENIGATRVVIDSISGFEMALAPTFREDFRESLYRLIGALTRLGVTIFSTVEVVSGAPGMQLTGYQVSFLTDEILSQRYVEIEGELRKVLTVVKMRGSNHSREFRAYELTATGVVLREWLRDFDGILSGAPTREKRLARPQRVGLTEIESMVFENILRAGSMTASDIAIQASLSALEVERVVDRLTLLSFTVQEGDRYSASIRMRDG